MAEQLNYLTAAGDLPNVSVQVIPLRAEAYSGLTVGPFEMLEFPRHPYANLLEPPVVYVRGYTGAMYLETAGEVEQYQDAYPGLHRSALDDAHSRSFIGDIANESAT